MTFVTQFNYFKKSIDSIFYSTPQIFEDYGITTLASYFQTSRLPLFSVYHLIAFVLCLLIALMKGE